MSSIKKNLIRLSCIALIVFNSLPTLQLLSMYNILLFGIGFLFTVLLFTSTGSDAKRQITIPLIIMLFIFLFTFISDNGSLRNGYLTYSVALFLPMLYIGVNDDVKRVLESALLISIPIIAITCVFTIAGCLSYPYASRRADFNTIEGPQLMAQGIGGYNFIYGLVFLTIDCILLFFSERKRFVKLIYIGFIGLACVTILLSNFTTAVLTLLIGAGLILLVLVRLGKVSKGKIILLATAAVAFVVVKGVSVDLSSGEGRIAQIFADNNKSVVEAIFDEFFEDRGPFIAESWDGVCNSPILGNAVFMSYEDSNYKYFGHHSFALDSWSLFGLVGVLFIYYMIRPITKLRKYSKYPLVATAYLIPLFIVIFLNNYCYFMLPTLYLFGLYSIEKFENSFS